MKLGLILCAFGLHRDRLVVDVETHPIATWFGCTRCGRPFDPAKWGYGRPKGAEHDR